MDEMFLAILKTSIRSALFNVCETVQDSDTVSVVTIHQ